MALAFGPHAGTIYRPAKAGYTVQGRPVCDSVVANAVFGAAKGQTAEVSPLHVKGRDLGLPGLPVPADSRGPLYRTAACR